MSTLYQKIEWVNEEDRIFRVGVWNHKRRPYFVYFREADEKNGEQEVIMEGQGDDEQVVEEVEETGDNGDEE